MAKNQNQHASLQEKGNAKEAYGSLFKTLYKFDRYSREFTGTIAHEKDNEELPLSTTDVAPPEIKAGFQAYWRNKRWVVEPLALEDKELNNE